uniref:Uncharacterized protein n=1 Tax=Aegilops tauschii subsp. strangulata TaxID=200361 RepID=A0A453Q827_AEGTS
MGSQAQWTDREEIWAQPNPTQGRKVVVFSAAATTNPIHLSLCRTGAAGGEGGSDGDLPAAARRRQHNRAAAGPPHPRQAEAAPRLQRTPPGKRKSFFLSFFTQQ